MGYITAILKFLLFGIIGLVSIWMIGVAMMAYPQPESAWFFITGVACLLMVASAWIIGPIPPRWP